MFESNSIIKASAGTGKTFALATRFIRLMMLDGVKPETIVALTFSRAAAQEIYTKILTRLCDAAAGEEGAQKEWNSLLEDFRNEQIPDGKAKLREIMSNPPAHGAKDFVALLRSLTDTQHLGAIATLDSFILRIVQNFPKELGFQNAVSVLDPIDERSAIDEAVSGALSKVEGANRTIEEALAVVNEGEFPRTCLAAIGNIIGSQGWRDFVIRHPESREWTVEGMCVALDVPPKSECPDLSEIPINEIPRKNAIAPEQKLIDRLKACDGLTQPFFFKAEGADVQMARFFWENPTAEEYAYSYYGKEYVVRCGAEGSKRLHDALAHAVNLYLKRQLEIVKAKIDLVVAVEAEYGRMTRRMGKLTFEDFTKYSAEEEFSARGIAIKNVEFRFDSKFAHWALDEFQDTSELQWRCLKELVKNAAGEGHTGEDRTAMAVGDMKQSIYTWRGASAQPFEELSTWPEFASCERDFRESHRYGPAIADFVNKVFGHGNIVSGGMIPEACSGAVEAWRKGWLDHVSHEAQDYVKVVAIPRDNENAKEAMLEALGSEVEEFWKCHQAARSTETAGVLVRSNVDGLAVAELLRSKGLPVVWEGMNPVSDVPVVQAVMSLVKLADHPSDTAAWKTVSELIDIKSELLPNCIDAAETSQAVAQRLSQQGLSRTLKEFCGKLRDGGRLAKDGLTCEKLSQLVELGVAFEERNGDGRVDSFLDFAAQSSKREIAASSEVIRVLTIHRSKGLGIDHVFVPIFESDRKRSAIVRPKVGEPLYDGGNWALSHLNQNGVQYNAHTRSAYRTMQGARFSESLRTYYVALTRAKKSMCVIIGTDDAAEGEGEDLLMSDLIAKAVGNSLPYEAGAMPKFARKEAKQKKPAPWPVLGTRVRLEMVTPSSGGHKAEGSRSASDLFDEDYGRAAERGIDVHARYQAIEWASEEEMAKLPKGFREAFERVGDEDEVWRERGYEYFDGKHWESGQFDRVVFRGRGEMRSATIYDFKTNAKGKGESDAAFIERMRRLYHPQMEAYRLAITRLTGIPRDRIAAKLLLEEAGESLSV